MKIVFLDESTITLNGDMNFSNVEALGSLQTYDLTTPEQMPERVGDAEVVIANKALLQRDTLEKLSNLQHIAVIATGYNNVDTKAARELGISVSNVSGYGRYTVPQHTFALILNLAGKVMEYSRDVQNGDWEAQESFTLMRYHTFELQGKTIGIVGFGAIGRGAAAIAEGFGMRVLVHDAFDFEHPTYENTPLEKLVEESDILTVHCPLTEQTRDLIGKRELKKMKRSALVINTARGGIVNEEALLEALETGEIAGAGLDTLTQEPPREHPLLYRKDLNLIVTPHCAWSAKEARQRLIDEVAENIKAFQAGRKRNIVN
ncbi:MAG: D-2-hydroxyacid dehydrogenase [Alkalispirochaetaceae bacterium]